MAEASKKRKDLSLQENQIILECYDKLHQTACYYNRAL
jgi:hypothetical protein